jgi:hypothetical protein
MKALYSSTPHQLDYNLDLCLIPNNNQYIYFYLMQLSNVSWCLILVLALGCLFATVVLPLPKLSFLTVPLQDRLQQQQTN